MLQLRKAGAEDARHVLDIQVRCFAELYERYRDEETNPAADTLEHTVDRIEREGSEFFIVSSEGKDIGLVRVQNMGDGEFWLGQLCILPEEQGRGYGQEVLRLVETLHPEARLWTLSTIVQEPKLLYLYEKMGYVRTDREETIKPGMDLVFYEKRKDDNNGSL